MALTEKGCFYCEPDHEGRLGLMIEFGKLKAGRVFLFKDQTHLGRCIVALDEHRTELFEMSEQQRHDFMDDVSAVAGAIKKLWGCDKINYAAYGDGVRHMHFHIVPKYKDGAGWGGAFDMNNPNKKFLSDAEYADMIAKLKKELGL